MLSRFQISRGWRPTAALPGSGALIVFQQMMRARNAWRDLAVIGLLFLCHQALALGFESMAMPLEEYTRDTPRFLLRLLCMSALAGPLLSLPCAAALGALAAPPRSRFAETQSMLLTRLTAWDVSAGRLLSGLWPVLGAVLASCALSLTVQLCWRPLMPGGGEGYAAIAVVHLVQICAVAAVGSAAFAMALRRGPGRVAVRGLFGGLILTGAALFGLMMVNSVVRRMDDPTRLIYGLLLINPATSGAAALHMDVLRTPWIYERTDAPEYPFRYPPPLASCAVFAGAAFSALTLASIRLRLAYR